MLVTASPGTTHDSTRVMYSLPLIATDSVTVVAADSVCALARAVYAADVAVGDPQQVLVVAIGMSRFVIWDGGAEDGLYLYLVTDGAFTVLRRLAA